MQIAAHVGQPSAELIAVSAGVPDFLEWSVETTAEPGHLAVANASNLSFRGLQPGAYVSFK